MTPLPCPFCGSKAFSYHVAEAKGSGVRCKNLACGVDMRIGGSDDKSIVTARWNTRSTPLRPRDEDPKGIALCLYENGTSRWWEPDIYWPVDGRWINERTGIRVVGWLPLPPTDLEVG